MRATAAATLILGAALLLICGGCLFEPPAEPGGGDTITVVTTLYPLADIVEQVGGEAVEAASLVPAGSSPHTFEPGTGELKQVARASLFVYVGAGLDDWVLKLAEAADTGTIKLNLTALPEISSRLLSSREGSHESAPEHGHGSSGVDPHIWLDPILVRDCIAPAVAQALQKLAPEAAEAIKDNLARFQEELTLLDREIKEAVAGFSRKDFITVHSAWQYFARRYGLNEIAVMASSGEEPSAGWMIEVVNQARERQIKVAFVEPQLSPALAESIAREVGARVLPLDPLGGKELEERDGYLPLMHFNLRQFEAALSERN